MSFTELASRAADVSDRVETYPRRRHTIVHIVLTAVGAVGTAAITLGWIALLIRGAIWLVGS